MAEVTKVREIVLAQHFKEDQININHVEKPYGEFSSPVVRINRVENGKNIGLIEIPYENIEEVISSLHKAEDIYDSIPHNDLHGDLKANVGGGA